MDRAAQNRIHFTGRPDAGHKEIHCTLRLSTILRLKCLPLRKREQWDGSVKCLAVIDGRFLP